MFTTLPNLNREELRFPETVLREFSFLEKQGFHDNQRSVTFVRYESSRVFVNVYHGRASYELNAEIGLLTASPDEKERAFSIGEILELISDQPKAAYAPPQASTVEGVKQFVPELALLVKKHAGPALNGDSSFFAELSALRQTNSDAYLIEMKLKRIRQEVDKAWRTKDYARVLDLYEPLQGSLTTVELKKLEYARKQLVQS
jgi:hypothetical protein